MTTPDPNNPIHNLPASTNSNQGLAIAKQLEASAQFILEGFIGQVLIAFGGIVILGQKPFAALAAIGQALIAQAQAAFDNANAAQATATTANTTANTAQGNWLSLFSGIPGISNVTGLLSFLIPSSSGSGIFGPLLNLIPGLSTLNDFGGFLSPTSSSAGIFGPLINLVTGGTTNPLSTLGTSLTGTASTASSANTNASSALSSLTSLLSGSGLGSFSSIGSTIASAASNFTTLFSGLGVPNIGAAVTSLLGTASTANTASTNASTANANIGALVDAVVTALRGIPFVGGTAADALEALTGFKDNVDTTAVNQQNFTITSFSNGNRNPRWYCRYPIADVTFPEFMFMELAVFGTTGAQSAGTAHTHPSGDTTNAQTGTFSIATGASRGGYITTAATTVYDTVACAVNTLAGMTLNNIFLEVFREASDGSLVQLFSREFSADISTTTQYHEYPMPLVIAQAGEQYLVRVRSANTTGVGSAPFVDGFVQLAAAVDMSMATTTSAMSVKTSYTAAEAAANIAAGNILPWVMLAAKNIADPDVSFSDDFNRANLGPWWVTSGVGNIVISGEQAVYGGTTSGDENILYIRRTTGDASLTSANLTLDPAATTQRMGLMLHCNRDLSQFVYLSVGVSDSKIYSFTGGTLTQRATVAVGGSDAYSLYYDLPNDKYVALKAGVAFGLQWTGVGSVITHGDNFKFGAARISRASSVNAGTLDNWLLRDFAA